MQKKELRFEILKIIKNLRVQNIIWFFFGPIFYLAWTIFFFWRYQDEELLNRILIMLFPFIITILSIYGDLLTNRELAKLIISITEDDQYFVFDMLDGKEIKVLKVKILIREDSWRLHIKKRYPRVKQYINTIDNKEYIWIESI